MLARVERIAIVVVDNLNPKGTSMLGLARVERNLNLFSL